MVDRSGSGAGWRRFSRWGVVALVVVLVAGGGAVAWAVTGSGGSSYRTALVSRGNVTAELSGTATIQPASEAAVNFPISGRVATVDVTLGQHVAAGAVLAQLDTTSLSSSVISAQSSVASAAARLAQDQASQTAVVTAATGTGGSPAAAGSTGDTPTSGSGAGRGSSTARPASGNAALATLAAQQAAIRGAQRQIDMQLAQVSRAITAASSVCQQLLATLGHGGGPSPSPSPSPTPTGSPSPSPSGSPGGQAGTGGGTAGYHPTPTPSPTGTGPGGGLGELNECRSGVTDVLTAETHIAAAEQSLATAETALSATLSRALQAAARSAQTTGSTSPASSTATSTRSTGNAYLSGAGGGGSTGSPRSASGSTPASAAQIAADQQGVDAADAQLTAAQQDVDMATLVSPIAGTVALLNIAAGQQVSAGNGSGSSADVVVIGPGASQAVFTVNDTNIGRVQVGQPATVTPDGADSAVVGRVISIGALNTTSDPAGYPVTIALPADGPPLFAGADATVTLTLGVVANAMTVPSSAVHTLGAFSFVTVLRSGSPTNVRVTLGAVGPTLTQVTSGLSLGERVVLADLKTPLPTNTSTFVRGLTGGFGGAVFRGGGAGAGGAGGRTGGG